MTGFETMRRAASMVLLSALVVLAVTPAAADPGPNERSGWERTSTATGGGQTSSTSSRVEQPKGNQIVNTASAKSDVRGWEATSVSTTRAPSADVTPEIANTVSISTTALYVAALMAALLLTIGTAVVLRRHGRPHSVA